MYASQKRTCSTFTNAVGGEEKRASAWSSQPTSAAARAQEDHRMIYLRLGRKCWQARMLKAALEEPGVRAVQGSNETLRSRGKQVPTDSGANA